LQPRPDPENANALSLQTKPKAGRRRWGHSTGLLKGDDWDDYEDNELTSLGGKAHFSTDKSKQGAEALSRYRLLLGAWQRKAQWCLEHSNLPLMRGREGGFIFMRPLKAKKEPALHLHLHFRAFGRCFYPKRLTKSKSFSFSYQISNIVSKYQLSK